MGLVVYVLMEDDPLIYPTFVVFSNVWKSGVNTMTNTEVYVVCSILVFFRDLCL